MKAKPSIDGPPAGKRWVFVMARGTLRACTLYGYPVYVKSASE